MGSSLLGWVVPGLWAGEKDKRLVERLYDETADIYDERYAESQRVKYVVVEDVFTGVNGFLSCFGCWWWDRVALLFFVWG